MAIKINYTSNVHWTREYLIDVLTSGKNPLVTDPQIVNALLRVDRADFIPENMRYLAYNDVSIDIGNDVKLEKPTYIARILTYLKPEYGENFLILGSSSGYLITLLSFIASDTGKVFSVEKHKLIHQIAKDNINKYDHTKNVDLTLGSVEVDVLPKKGPYDVVVSNYIVDIAALSNQLSDGGVLIAPSIDSSLILIERKGMEFEEEMIDLSD